MSESSFFKGDPTNSNVWSSRSVAEARGWASTVSTSGNSAAEIRVAPPAGRATITKAHNDILRKSDQMLMGNLDVVVRIQRMGSMSLHCEQFRS